MRISEIFYSVQCEGISTGIPSVFIRLQSCNLECGSTKEALKANAPTGQLQASGAATWTCDTIPVWRTGTEYTNEQVAEKLKSFGQDVYRRIWNGRVHLIWTGGEPTLPRNQKDIKDFLLWADEALSEQDGNARWFPSLYNEIETNGTINPEPYFYDEMDQINCSPKLANSGMPRARRIVPEAIVRIKNHPNYQFKFVINREEDLTEIQNDFLLQFGIPSDKVVLMPGVDRRSELAETTAFTLDMAKKYGYRAITRTHILAWDRVTGV